MHLEEQPTTRATTRRRHLRSTTSPGIHQEADVMVDADGRLRVSPIYAAMSRTFQPHTATRWKRHEGVELVCVMIAGELACECIGQDPFVLGREDVAVLSTGAGVEYRWHAIGDEPARALFFWLPSRMDRTPYYGQYRARRTDRLGALTGVAGWGTRLPTTERVRVSSAVLTAGSSVVHVAHHRRCYIVPTLGPIYVDGVVARPNAGIVSEGGALEIHALESTEVLVVEV